MKNIAISEIMSKNVVTVDKDETLGRVKEIFEKRHLRHIPVVSGKKLVGIISLLDLMRLTFGDSKDDEMKRINDTIYKNVPVEKVMIEKPMTLRPNSTIKEAAEIFEMDIFHSIPVVENGELKGIITETDLIRYLNKNLQ